jgi:hypothetical protein
MVARWLMVHNRNKCCRSYGKRSRTNTVEIIFCLQTLSLKQKSNRPEVSKTKNPISLYKGMENKFKKTWLWCGCAVLEDSTNNPKFEGSNS